MDLRQLRQFNFVLSQQLQLLGSDISQVLGRTASPDLSEADVGVFGDQGARGDDALHASSFANDGAHADECILAHAAALKLAVRADVGVVTNLCAGLHVGVVLDDCIFADHNFARVAPEGGSVPDGGAKVGGRDEYFSPSLTRPTMTLFGAVKSAEAMDGICPL